MEKTENIIAELVRVYETAVTTLRLDIAAFAADRTLPPASRRANRDWCYPEIRLHYAGEETRPDLARAFGVTHATVNKTIARLNKEGLVRNEKYHSLFLTETGKKLAESCKARHEIVVSFLTSIGVSPRTAELDAEGVEHHISTETLKAFATFVKKHKQ